MESAPVLADGILYAASKDGIVWAFDPATGKVRWKEPIYNLSPATPLVQDSTLYVGGRSPSNGRWTPPPVHPAGT